MVRWILLGGLLAVVAVLLLVPQSHSLLRGALLLAIVGSAILALVLVWGIRLLRWLALVLALLVLVPPFLPARRDPEAERASYVSTLHRYRGVPYVWGGENELGTDCSGLVRRALIRSQLVDGYLVLDGGRIRSAFDLWWHDASAQELLAGYGGRTRRLGRSGTLNSLEPGRARAGDLAVTVDGRHVLACLGDGAWIQADPGSGKVRIARVPEPVEPWFRVPVEIVGWTTLQD